MLVGGLNMNKLVSVPFGVGTIKLSRPQTEECAGMHAFPPYVLWPSVPPHPVQRLATKLQGKARCQLFMLCVFRDRKCMQKHGCLPRTCLTWHLCSAGRWHSLKHPAPHPAAAMTSFKVPWALLVHFACVGHPCRAVQSACAKRRSWTWC